MAIEFHGVLTFHSETGTEGGYWAMQDEKYMGLAAPPHFVCSKCGRIWDKARDVEPPKPSFTYYRPGWEENGTTYIGGYFGSYVPRDDLPTTFGDEPEGSFNDEFTKAQNAKARECYDNGHGEWESLYPNGTWSPHGLHILRDGDVLTIYNPDNPEEVVWEGTIQLVQYPLFTEHAGGMWIHADQVGVPREEWATYFFVEYPCKLVTQYG